jgi:hypothetical protein
MLEDNRPVDFKFALGLKVKDITCGFEGIITARIQSLNGCLQYTVTPKVESATAERRDAWNIDEEQLVKVDRGITQKVRPKPAAVATGGPATRASSSNRVRR